MPHQQASFTYPHRTFTRSTTTLQRSASIHSICTRGFTYIHIPRNLQEFSKTCKKEKHPFIPRNGACAYYEFGIRKLMMIANWSQDNWTDTNRDWYKRKANRRRKTTTRRFWNTRKCRQAAVQAQLFEQHTTNFSTATKCSTKDNAIISSDLLSFLGEVTKLLNRPQANFQNLDLQRLHTIFPWRWTTTLPLCSCWGPPCYCDLERCSWPLFLKFDCRIETHRLLLPAVWQEHTEHQHATLLSLLSPQPPMNTHGGPVSIEERKRKWRKTILCWQLTSFDRGQESKACSEKPTSCKYYL